MKNRIRPLCPQLFGRHLAETGCDVHAPYGARPGWSVTNSDGPVKRNMVGTVMGIRSGPRACFMLLFCVTMFSATALASRPDESNSVGTGAVQSVSGDSANEADCATCHKEVVKDFATNPHNRPLLMHGGKGVTCESCHGPGKAHAEAGDATKIFNPASATAKEVHEKCGTCHKARHANFERSAHDKGNVSCIGCHSVHSAGVRKHLLKMEQPQLCYQCHGDVKPQFSMPFHHKVEEGLMQCTDCHDAHGALGENALPSSTWQFIVCAKCHAAKAGPFVYEHAVLKAEGCTACHLPHGGTNRRLLTQANVNTICLQCHLPSPNSPKGQPAVPEHIQSAQSQSCISCHSSIHGSNVSDVFLSPAQKKRTH